MIITKKIDGGGNWPAPQRVFYYKTTEEEEEEILKCVDVDSTGWLQLRRMGNRHDGFVTFFNFYKEYKTKIKYAERILEIKNDDKLYSLVNKFARKRNLI